MKKTFSGVSTRIPSTPFNRALKFLSYRQRSTKEIQIYLKKKGYSEFDINSTIKKLEEYHFIDDKAFSSLLTNSLQKKGKSRKHIKFELTLKGISREQILDTIDTAKSDFTIAKNYTTKLLNKLEQYNNEEKKKKIISRLKMSGFSWEIISKIIKQLDTNA